MWRTLQKVCFLTEQREIHRIYTSHTLRGIALSFVSVYVPIYFLTRGYTVPEVVGYYALLHGFGLLMALTAIPWLIKRLGIIRAFKLNYPIESVYFLLLFLLPFYSIPLPLIAIIGGTAVFIYWVPLNILLIKHSDFDKMGSDMANFFALPKLFSIVGPLIGGALVYLVGFWPTFCIAMLGMLLSYIPMALINTSEIRVHFDFRQAWSKLKQRKFLFFLEGLDNIIEESEWFWGIYVYLLIGSLVVPGIIGSLESIGGALFAFLSGRLANRSDKKMVLGAAVIMMLISVARLFVVDAFIAYSITVVASFMMTAFLAGYFSVIYRSVKGDEEEEFIILREIPTVLGRMIVFGCILMTLGQSRYYFILPLIITGILGATFSAKLYSQKTA